MFLNICYFLNVVYLSWISAALRYIAYTFLPTEQKFYANPDQVGYAGWVESPIGVLAFIRPDNRYQWVW